jgi:hypothetical protein
MCPEQRLGDIGASALAYWGMVPAQYTVMHILWHQWHVVREEPR